MVVGLDDLQGFQQYSLEEHLRADTPWEPPGEHFLLEGLSADGIQSLKALVLGSEAKELTNSMSPGDRLEGKQLMLPEIS